MKNSSLLTALVVLAALAGQPAQAAVHEYQLDNGMKILVKEDHRSPVVVSQIWYKVGSSYEYAGITGVSHVLEHMMFKGTERHPAGEFSRIIAENGGRENAFTGRDYTSYFQHLEKSRLEISFEMEADRMRNLTLPNDEFLKELEVVKEERKLRTEDKPRSYTYEQFYAAAFNNSSYHNPIIGWMNDLDNMKVDDLRDWYQRWYSPNNATLVVAGDVTGEQVYQLAKKHFAGIRPSNLAGLKPRVEVEQKGMREISVRLPSQLPYLMMGYKVPVLKTAENDQDVYALEMLAYVLSGINSSRFPRDLVRKQQIAASADTGYNLYARQQDLFLIDATPAAKVSLEKLEQAIRQQIQKLKKELVSESELDRIKAQVVASKVYEKDSVFYQAMTLGLLETVGLEWRLESQYLDKIRKVTPQQIREVARKYLVDEKLTIGRLIPLPMQSATREGAH